MYKRKVLFVLCSVLIGLCMMLGLSACDLFANPTKDGVDAASVVDAYVDENKHLILVMSDNTTIDAGYVGIDSSVDTTNPNLPTETIPPIETNPSHTPGTIPPSTDDVEADKKDESAAPNHPDTSDDPSVYTLTETEWKSVFDDLATLDKVRLEMRMTQTSGENPIGGTLTRMRDGNTYYYNDVIRYLDTNKVAESAVGYTVFDDEKATATVYRYGDGVLYGKGWNKYSGVSNDELQWYGWSEDRTVHGYLCRLTEFCGFPVGEDETYQSFADLFDYFTYDETQNAYTSTQYVQGTKATCTLKFENKKLVSVEIDQDAGVSGAGQIEATLTYDESITIPPEVLNPTTSVG